MAVSEYTNLTIRRHTKGGIPTLPFVAVKEAILGKKYELSLSFPNLETARELHSEWKNKENPVDVLAFPLDEYEGEIILTLAMARKQASLYDHSYLEHVLFLFIHACLHLKGFEHGDIMEKQEQKYLKKFYSKTM